MGSIILPLSLHDVFLHAIHLDTTDEVLQRVTHHLCLPAEQSEEARHALSHLLAPILKFQKYELLEQLFDTLLEHGITVQATAVKAAVALPMPQAAVHLEKLFSLGWDVNTSLGNAEPPVLSIAVDDISLTCWLLLKGADPNAPCDIDYTPLSVAVKKAQLPVVRLLLQFAQNNNNGHLVFHATQREDMDESVRLIRLLHQHGKPIDEILYKDLRSNYLRAQFPRGTPLYYACKNNKLPVAQALLELGADPDKACEQWDQIIGPSPREVATSNRWEDFGRRETR